MAHQEYHRTDRISVMLRKEMGMLVHEVVRDKLVPSVSVSDLEVTRDLAYANVFVTALDPNNAMEAVKLLNEGAKDFRRELAKRVKLRHVPELRFKYDDSVDRGENIERLLRKLPDTQGKPSKEDKS